MAVVNANAKSYFWRRVYHHMQEPSKQSLEKSAALKLRMEGYYQSIVQQAKERESR
jgi:hypothetical protein